MIGTGELEDGSGDSLMLKIENRKWKIENRKGRLHENERMYFIQCDGKLLVLHAPEGQPVYRKIEIMGIHSVGAFCW